MKKIVHFSLCTTMLIFCCACSSDNTEDGSTDHDSYIVNGSVQKGQFIQGSTVTIQELDENLQPAGNNYQTQILDDMGTFKLSSEIKNRYVEIIANGYYFDEIAGKLSNGPLTLRAISDLSLEGVSNVNILTSLEAPRIKYLVLNERRTIPEARKIAEMEVLQSFNIPQNEFSAINGGFDKMDIARPGSNNAILLAISATLQHKRTVAELSEIISKIAADIEVNGQLKDETLLSSIRNNGMEIDAKKVSSNLEKRYNELSVLGYAIPDFEGYLDIDGNGVIDKYDNWQIEIQNGKEKYYYSAYSSTDVITLKSNIPYKILNKPNWIDIKEVQADNDLINLQMTISPNYGLTTRNCLIKLQGYTKEAIINIEQEAASKIDIDAVLKQECIRQNHDKNRDGEISITEAIEISSFEIWPASQPASSMGMEHFINLSTLKVSNWPENEPHFDASFYPKLINLKLDIQDLNIKTINIKENRELKELLIRNKNLVSVDITGNPALENLYLIYTPISTINLSNNSKLKLVSFQHTCLENIDFSYCTSLESIQLENETNISSINISNNQNLKTLILHNTSLSSLDLSQNINLEELYITDNTNLLMTSLDLSLCNKLKFIMLKRLPLTTLDISKCPLLISLDIENSKIATLDIYNNTLLTFLRCSQSPLKTLYMKRGHIIDGVNDRINPYGNIPSTTSIIYRD